MNDYFLFDIWFASDRSNEAAMDVGEYMIGMVKLNTQGLCKNTIEKLTNDWPGDSYFVLNRKSTVPRDRPPISIVHKYNTRKALFFIYTEDEGSKKSVITYLSK